jgi:general secretion pathway protein C
VVDTYFKQYFWTFHLIALFGVAFLLARTVNAFVGGALETPAEDIAGPAERPAFRPAAPKEAAIGLTAFLDRNLFKAAREDLTPEPLAGDEAKAPEGEFDANRCNPCTMGVELVATIVSDDPEASLAVFTDRGKEETEAYRHGEKIQEQAEVMVIDWRRVLVKRNGQCESFTLEDKNPDSAVAAAPPPPDTTGAPAEGGEFGKNVKQTGSDEYEIPRAEIDNVLSNLNQIATQARIVPSFQNGKANGFKLFSIRPGSLYSKIGIQNGDIIQKINGFEINSPDKALEIYSKLKDANGITVDLIRRGKTKTLSYSIR